MDYSGLRERQVLYAVSVPGETEWYKRSLDASSSSSCEALVDRISHLNVNGRNSSSSTALSHKYPIPEEPHTGALIKLYPYSTGKAGDDQPYKATEIVDLVGVLDYTPFPTSASEQEEGQTPEGEGDASTGERIQSNDMVKTLHVVMAIPVDQQSVFPISAPSSPTTASPASSSETEGQNTRRELVAYLSSVLEGDELAAEWLLLSLLGKM